MAPLRITTQGVGPHSGNSTIPAEEYYSLGSIGEKRNGGSTSGFVVENLQSGSSLTYRVKGFSSAMNLNLTVANGAKCMGVIEISTDDSSAGLYQCKVAPTGGWNMFETVSCTLAEKTNAKRSTRDDSSVVELVLSFAGCEGVSFARLDNIIFF